MFCVWLLLVAASLSVEVGPAVASNSEEHEDPMTCDYWSTDSHGRLQAVRVFCQFGCCRGGECCEQEDDDKDGNNDATVSTKHKWWLVALFVLAGVLIVAALSCCAYGFYKHKVAAKTTVPLNSQAGSSRKASNYELKFSSLTPPKQVPPEYSNAVPDVEGDRTFSPPPAYTSRADLRSEAPVSVIPVQGSAPASTSVNIASA